MGDFNAKAWRGNIPNFDNPQDMGSRLSNISCNSNIDELMNSPSLHQQDCSNADEEMEDSRLAKCMDEFDPEAFLNSIDSI